MAALLEKIYEQDFYLWLMKNAELIRQGRFSETDSGNIAEELECMGRSEKRELTSRLAVLLTHLLKWSFEPDKRTNSRKYSIVEQRREILELLNESPGLCREFERQFDYAYESALIKAAKETGMDTACFPQQCPFSSAQVMDKNFYPDNSL